LVGAPERLDDVIEMRTVQYSERSEWFVHCGAAQVELAVAYAGQLPIVRFNQKQVDEQVQRDGRFRHDVAVAEDVLRTRACLGGDEPPGRPLRRIGQPIANRLGHTSVDGA